MPKAIKKVRRRSAARNRPKGDLPKIPVAKAGKPKFETVITRPVACPCCGWPIQQPRAGSILLLESWEHSFKRTDLYFKREEKRVEAKAMAAWHKTPAGKAWRRLMLKPSKAAWHAFLALDDKQRGFK